MTHDLLLFGAVFLACAVESVEAVTVVLAAGLTRGWRSAMAGTAAALLLLAVIVAILGPTLTVLPVDVLRLVVGGLLLVFGLQWLRKAILLEAAFIALTLGSNQDDVPLAALAAAVAVTLVVVAALAARRPLARVPETALMFSVGVMLSAFGIFWGAEGAGADWPGGDAAILALIALLLAVSGALIFSLRRRHDRRPLPATATPGAA